MPLYTNYQEFAEYLGLSGSTPERLAGKVTVMNLMLDGCEQQVEKYTGRFFSPTPALDGDGGDTGTPVAKTFKVRKATVRIPDLRTATSVTLDGATLTEGSGYDIEDYGEPATHIKLLTWTPYTWQLTAYSQLTITGRWGFNPTPADIKDATYRMAGRFYREREAMWSDSMETPDGTGFLFRSSWIETMPKSVRGVLDMYALPRVGFAYGVR